MVTHVDSTWQGNGFPTVIERPGESSTDSLLPALGKQLPVSTAFREGWASSSAGRPSEPALVHFFRSLFYVFVPLNYLQKGNIQ